MLVAGIVAVAALVGAPPAQAAPGPFLCHYTFSSWPGGFTADLLIYNSGPPVVGWTARMVFPAPAQLGVVWSAELTQPTAVEMVATPAPWNKTIATNGVVLFGWTASAVTAHVPSLITVNGVPC